MLRWLTPTAYFDSIYDIDIEDLIALGVKGIIIDLDNTLIPRDEDSTPKKLLDWLDDLKKRGLKICVVSNNTNARGQIIANKIDRPLISMAKKPSRAAFKKALQIMGTVHGETVVVGDQIFTDVFGGNRMGLKTILVVPLHGRDFIVTVLMRKIERLILKKLTASNKIEKNKRLGVSG